MTDTPPLAAREADPQAAEALTLKIGEVFVAWMCRPDLRKVGVHYQVSAADFALIRNHVANALAAGWTPPASLAAKTACAAGEAQAYEQIKAKINAKGLGVGDVLGPNWYADRACGLIDELTALPYASRHFDIAAQPAPSRAGEAVDEDEIGDAISDSLDMDWTSRDGARAVMALLRKKGIVQ